MSILLVAIVAVAVLVVGFVMPGVRENRRYSALPKQQTLPSPEPQPKVTSIESYHTLAEIWDHTLSGATAVSPAGDMQYAAKRTDDRNIRILRCDAYARARPSRKSEYVRIVGAGFREHVIGYVYGEPYAVSGQSSDVWFVLEDKSMVWSGSFTDQSTVGLHCLYPYKLDGDPFAA